MVIEQHSTTIGGRFDQRGIENIHSNSANHLRVKGRYIAYRFDRPITWAMTKDESKAEAATAADDDEPDEWEQRIFSTGCADENAKLTDCYYEKKDWRACKDEMEKFRACWKAHNNDERTSTKDVEPEK